MCGFIGIISRNNNVAYDLFIALNNLQHRGQDGAGILTFDGNEFYMQKGIGLVNEFFSEQNLSELKGKIGIGHVRYPTIGSDPKKDVQPFVTYQPFGIGMCHNGNLVNYDSLKELLLKKYQRRMRSGNDIETILGLFASELQKNSKAESVCTENDIFGALKNTVAQLNGGYSCVSVVAGKGLLGFRDPNGIRPIVFAEKTENGKVVAYALASETVALDILGFKVIKDLEPGEAILVDENMQYYSKILAIGKKRPCMFEWVYFARADSVIENKGVYEVRLNLGSELAKIWAKKGIEADVVVPVPDSSKSAAITFAQETGLPYREGLIKNRYIGRTFIMPYQKKREFSVRMKLNPIIREIKGKRVILIDDSIVRGTTSKKIIQMVREAGAKEVHFVVTCPPIKYPCFYAVDFASKYELIAGEKTIEEIRKEIGADSLTYQGIENLKNAIGLGNNLCMACLTGEYVTDVSEGQAKVLGEQREKERAEWKHNEKASPISIT